MIPDTDLHKAVALVCPSRPFMLSPETYDGLTMLDDGPKPTLEELEEAWATRPPEARRWPNVEAFVAEFTLEELAMIELSQVPSIAALRLKLNTWLSAVHADDPLVVQGRSELVAAGIITTERAAQIFDHAS